jgi:hypothetical protein
VKEEGRLNKKKVLAVRGPEDQLTQILDFENLHVKPSLSDETSQNSSESDTEFPHFIKHDLRQ